MTTGPFSCQHTTLRRMALRWQKGGHCQLLPEIVPSRHPSEQAFATAIGSRLSADRLFRSLSPVLSRWPPGEGRTAETHLAATQGAQPQFLENFIGQTRLPAAPQYLTGQTLASGVPVCRAPSR